MRFRLSWSALLRRRFWAVVLVGGGWTTPLLAAPTAARPAIPTAAPPATPVLAAEYATPPLLQSLEAALNAPDDAPLAALLRTGPGLEPDRLLQRRKLLRQRFTDLRWRVSPGPLTSAGQPTVALALTGSRVQGRETASLTAQQTLILRSDGRHINAQTLLAESSMLRSGDPTLPVLLQIPDAVLTGQSYDVDLIVEEPLDGALVAGALAAVSAEQLAAMESPSLELGALGGGGLFKSVRAPQVPGSQTWAVLMVHPRAVISATKRVRVVADRRALQL